MTGGASGGCWFTRGVYQQTFVDGAGGAVGKPGGITNKVKCERRRYETAGTDGADVPPTNHAFLEAIFAY